MIHKHSVVDTDTHFVIDKDTREIRLEAANLPMIVQHDHNSERFTFEVPKLIDGHDMTLCNSVQVHYINVDSSTKDTAKGVYEVDDLTADGDKAVCSWLVSSNATKYAGKLNFMVRFACVADDGSVTYAWNTAVYTDVTVAGGMNNGDAIATEEYADILAQWKADLFGVGDTVEQEIVAKGEEIKATLSVKAPAIVLKAEGESIALHDASDCHLQGLRVFGKSTQDGTPTPDAPVEIVSVENPQIAVYGANLANLQNMALSSNKTFDVSGDGYTITVTGGSDNGYCSSTTFLNHALLAGKTVVLSADSIASENADAKAVVQMSVFASSGNRYEAISANLLKRTVDIPGDVTKIILGVYTNNNATAIAEDNTVVAKGVGVYLADIGWERCKDKQPLEMAHTLRGIPVTSGGNYTDANGQQWICDEVDLKRGVYVQRVFQAELSEENIEYGTAYGENGYMDFTIFYPSDTAVSAAKYANYAKFTHFATNYEYRVENEYGYCANTRIKIFSNRWGSKDEFCAWLTAQQDAGTPVSILYVLASPIEANIPESEIAAFKELHSNYPNTTVLNDAGAHMEVEYVADTKTYIDNKIAELMAN